MLLSLQRAFEKALISDQNNATDEAEQAEQNLGNAPRAGDPDEAQVASSILDPDALIPIDKRVQYMKALLKVEHRALEDRVESYICPITLEIMQDPVISRYGHSFERWAIEEWIEEHGSCPLTMSPLTKADLLPNRHLKSVIRSDVDNFGLDVLSGARHVKNHGLVTIAEHAKQLNVEVVTGARICELDRVEHYNPLSAFLLLPKPKQLLGFGATAAITLKHNGIAGEFKLISWDRDAVIAAAAAAKNNNGGDAVVQPSGEFALKPGQTHGFDIQGRFVVEIQSGDCALLEITNFVLSGGGQGDALGMAGRY